MWRWLVVSFSLVAMEGLAQQRRGPPRGPIKGDQSQFFGKEGEHQPATGVPKATIVIAIVMAAILVAVKVYMKPQQQQEKRS
mmetsp:Transcript_29864/g.96364  ORF Transcript_29864/g.96364 Transcript_29864/m.96364 type:complete len:82 (+) Transcript_29864:18-263(+)